MNKTVKMKHKITPAPSDSEGTGQEDFSKNADSKEKKLKESRLRRCKSVSRAQEIVTEDEKQRRAQPDKP